MVLLLALAFWVVLLWLLARLFSRERGPIKVALLAAMILIVLDVIILDQGFMTVVVIGLVLPFQLLLCVFWALKGRREQLPRHLAAAGIYLGTTLLIIGWISANNMLAASRAETLILDCRRYEAKNKRLPNELEDLVPEFLATVPRARYTLSRGEFIYLTVWPSKFSEPYKPTEHVLGYWDRPATGPRFYSFEQSAWREPLPANRW
jgi:hypothetical protein